MSHWNYRVMRRRVKSFGGKSEIVYGIKEVYYDDKGRPNGYTKDDMAPFGNTLVELRENLMMMGAATLKPIIKPGDCLRRKKKKSSGGR